MTETVAVPFVPLPVIVIVFKAAFTFAIVPVKLNVEPLKLV